MLTLFFSSSRRSMRMNLHSMSKVGFIIAFVIFAVVFLISIIIGATGAFCAPVFAVGGIHVFVFPRPANAPGTFR